jgi:ribosomal protein S18 acetylase RimI-like enzyme
VRRRVPSAERHQAAFRESLAVPQTLVVTAAIRPYRPDDAEALVSLWALCDLTRPWNDPFRDIERKIDADPNGLLVLEEDRQCIGAVKVGYDGHRGWINYLAVHPDHRGRGLGRLLVATAEQRLSELGCPKVNLQVRAANKDAVEFYQSVGYSVDEVVSMGRRLDEDR